MDQNAESSHQTQAAGEQAPATADLRGGVSEELAERIVAAYSPMVSATCLRVLRDPALAQDAAQEVFILLFRKASRLDPATVLGGWLYRSSIHIASTQLRTRRRRRARESHPDVTMPAPSVPGGDTPPWEKYLDDAIAHLPVPRKNLVVACYLNGQTQRETARQLGWSESKVSRELQTALEAMRGFLQRKGHGAGTAAIAATLAAWGTRDAFALASSPSALIARATQGTAAGTGAVPWKKVMLLSGATCAGIIGGSILLSMTGAPDADGGAPSLPGVIAAGAARRGDVRPLDRRWIADGSEAGMGCLFFSLWPERSPGQRDRLDSSPPRTCARPSQASCQSPARRGRAL